MQRDLQQMLSYHTRGQPTSSDYGLDGMNIKRLLDLLRRVTG